MDLQDVRCLHCQADLEPGTARHELLQDLGASAPALVLPRCDIPAMNLHLAEIATKIAPRAHAVLVLDQAGWHMSSRLVVPANITLAPLPPKCPERNPVENLWQFMRDNWLSNRVFTSLQGHRRPLLSRREQTHRPILAHHVNRTARLGAQVVIREAWY